MSDSDDDDDGDDDDGNDNEEEPADKTLTKGNGAAYSFLRRLAGCSRSCGVFACAQRDVSSFFFCCFIIVSPCFCLTGLFSTTDRSSDSVTCAPRATSK